MEKIFSMGLVFRHYARGMNKVSESLNTVKTEFIRTEGMGGGVGGMLYSIAADGTRTYSHSNHRGDVIARSDSSRSLTSFALYEAYGTRPYEWSDGVTGDPDRQKANTKEEEKDLGLVNDGRRYRDLETGTYLTRDPIGYVDGPNIYCYVHCNPITHFDALGLSQQEITDAIGGVADSQKKVDEADENLSLAADAWAEAFANYDPDDEASVTALANATALAITAGDMKDKAQNQLEKSLGALISIIREHDVDIRGATVNSEGVALYIGTNEEGLNAYEINAKKAIAGTGTGISILGSVGLDVYGGTTGYWLAPNGKFYSNHAPGNQYTGFRIKDSGRIAKNFKTVGNYANYVTTGIGVYDTVNALWEQDYYRAAESCADTSAGIIGFFGAPGRAYSYAYTVGSFIDDGLGVSDAIANKAVPYTPQAQTISVDF